MSVAVEAPFTSACQPGVSAAAIGAARTAARTAAPLAALPAERAAPFARCAP